MKHNGTPVLDPRDAGQVLQELLARRPAYVPELSPSEGGAAQALFQIFARYMQVVIERLNQTPDKNLLAFLDMLGISLIPTQAARAPVVFTPLLSAGDGRIPERTRLGAEGPGREEPIVFETERAIALAGARLVEVKTLWPARDEYADHSAETAGGRPFTLFESRRPTPHEFYLAHDTLLAFSGDASVEIEFELSTPGSTPLTIAWEFWDGQVWQAFEAFGGDGGDSKDSTAGLTRSGAVTLHVACGRPQKLTINGIEAYWVRGRLDQSLPPDPARVLAMVDRVRARSVMNRQLRFLFVTPFPVGGTLALGATARAAAMTSPAPVFDPLVDLLRPDEAFSNGLSLDVTQTFHPFGQQPLPGSTFYFTSEEIFTKPGATMIIYLEMVRARQPDPKTGEQPLKAPRVEWEYWDGDRWAHLEPMSLDPGSPEVNIDLTRFQLTAGELDHAAGAFNMAVPADMVPVAVNNSTKRWMRARLVSGAYGLKREVSFQGPDPALPDMPDALKTFSFTIIETVPPAITAFRLGYVYRSPWEYPEHCIAYNDFQFELHSHDVRWPGGFFPPFRPVADVQPALYLGFDRPLPNDFISLHLDIQEHGVPTPPLVWEAWDGTAWRKLSVADETAHLSRPGMASFIAPDVAPRPVATISRAQGQQITVSSALEAAVFRPSDQVVMRQDKESEMVTVQEVQGEVITLETPLTNTYTGGSVSRAALPRFGRPLDWVRARLKDDRAPERTRINAMYLNATWAVQVQTVENEVLGSGTGQPNQTLFFTQSPILSGEAIEVRELEGARAEVELPILQEELRKRGGSEADMRTVTDARTGRITEVWVRWQSRPHLFFSDPDDRHYMVERTRGRLIFGDGQNGRIPPIGANNIRAVRYQAGGGLAGNVLAGAITQLLGAASVVQSVNNPRAADGGAEGETPEAVKLRGPEQLRHWGRTLAACDYESLAREASPGVAVARALPATAPNGRPAPGWVTVIIAPQSLEPQPQPSFELRRRVHEYLAARAPAALAMSHIAVVGPTYLPVGVSANVVPREIREAGLVEERVRVALERFLHPLTGGPEGRGWPFGRDVFLSDVAAVLESVDGVDFASELELLLGDIPQGERVAVPPDRIVVVGTLRIEMRSAEG